MLGDWKHAVSLWIQSRVHRMNESAFQDMLDRLGDDLKSWPADERDEAEVLLQASAQARRVFNEAKRLRAAFAELPKPLVPQDFLSRMLARIEILEQAQTATPAE
jgi:hypothetical protein